MTGPAVAHQRPPFFWYLYKQAPFVLLAIGLGYILHHAGAFKTFEGAALDTLLRTAAPHPVTDIVIVTIDDQDFTEVFKSKSPLAVDRLQEVLDATARGRPALIGVDLDTSDPSFAALRPPSIPTVWARGAVPATTEGETPTVCMDPVLGGAGSGLPTGASFGVALAPLDADGVVRKYFRTFGIGTPEACTGATAAADPTNRSSSVPSFVGALHRSALNLAQDTDDTESEGKPLILNFAGDRFVVDRIPARGVLSVSHTPGFAESGPLTGRIVLIGGTWRAARDEYLTSVGQMSGVELAAQALAAERAGGGISEVDDGAALALEGLMAIALVWVAWRFSFGRALAISIFGLPVLALVGSLLAFRAFAFWFDFLAPMLGVFLHLLIDHAREYAVLRKELAEVQTELTAALDRERTRGAEAPSGEDRQGPPSLPAERDEAGPAVAPPVPPSTPESGSAAGADEPAEGGDPTGPGDSPEA